ncbi:unnamed protein product, partial [Closterium sp. Yama58-4]
LLRADRQHPQQALHSEGVHRRHRGLHQHSDRQSPQPAHPAGAGAECGHHGHVHLRHRRRHIRNEHPLRLEHRSLRLRL